MDDTAYYDEMKRMLRGEPFKMGDPCLSKLQKEAKIKVQQTAEEYMSLLGSVGDDLAEIEAPVFFDFGCNIYIGKRFKMGPMCVILDCGRVDIGDDVKIGPGVVISAAEHPSNPQQRWKCNDVKVTTSRPIRIGNNVVIGGRASILPGVTIGNGVTVGAGAVVNRDVPDNVVVAGVPAKIIKSFPEM